MSFVNEVEGEVAGASPGGGLHADQGVFGAGLHAASALAHNALDAGHDLTGGLSRAGGHLMGGLGHGASDLLHGDLRGAIGDVSGGVRGAGGDLAQAQLDAMGHLGIPPGAIPAAQAGFGVFQGARTAWSSYQGNAPPGQTRVEGMATGVGGINSALGFGHSNIQAF
jgi:hypothetical protein